MTDDLVTIADVAKWCGCTVRTANRHAQRDGVGKVLGRMRVLTLAESDRLSALIAAAKPGRPVKNP